MKATPFLLCLLIFSSMASAENIFILSSPADVTIGETFTANIDVEINSEVDVVEATNITYQPPGIIHYKTTTQSTECDIWFCPDCGTPGEIHNDLGWARPITWAVFKNNTVNNTLLNLATVTWEAKDVGQANFDITPTTVYIGEELQTSYQGTSTVVHPDKPTSFNMDVQKDKIIITWGLGTGANQARIERKQGTTNNWEVGDGDLVFEGEGTEFTDTTYEVNTTYRYLIWCYNNNADVYSINPLSQDIISPLEKSGIGIEFPDIGPGIYFIAALVILLPVSLIVIKWKEKKSGKQPKEKKTKKEKPETVEEEDDIFY